MTRKLLVALCVRTKKIQFKNNSSAQWPQNKWVVVYSHTEYYTTVKMSDIPLYATTWVNLTSIILSEKASLK